MSRLKDFVSKGVRLIVADTPEAAAVAAPADLPAGGEIPPEELGLEPPRSAGPSAVAADADFGAVYQEAGIDVPLHGYGIDKVGEMLESKRLASLSREVKATAILAALEAAGVAVKDVLQDAVRRDAALDAFEAAKEQEARDLKDRNDGRVQEVKDEIEAFLRQKNEEIETLKRESEAASQAFTQLHARKQREEERLFEVVSHFAEGAQNPITTASRRPTSPPPPPKAAD